MSLCSQAVQLGAVPALIALRLNASGFSVSVVGVVAAAPWMAVLLLGRRIPRLLARHNYRPVNATALAISAAAVAAIIFATNPYAIFAANFCLGVGLIFRWIACDSWIIALAPDAIRGRAIGIHETLMGCGIAAGPLIIAIFGSQTAAPLLACLGLLFVATYALVSVGPSVAPEMPLDSPSTRRLRRITLMALAAFIAGFIETSSVSFLPVLSLHAHWPIVSTLALGVFTLGGTLLQLPIGYLADKLGYRVAQLITAGVIIGSSATFIVMGHQFVPLLITLFTLGGAAGAMNTLAVIEAGSSVAANLIADAAARVALAYTVGSIIGPPILGFLVSILGPTSFPFVFATIGVAFCAARLLARPQASGVKTTLPTAVFEAGT
ncbi:MAG TPA: MFS transporter [Acetobacteraceae bacterium]|nr:MFS transporter [Acetobacteraceae bacterium]